MAQPPPSTHLTWSPLCNPLVTQRVQVGGTLGLDLGKGEPYLRHALRSEWPSIIIIIRGNLSLR